MPTNPYQPPGTDPISPERLRLWPFQLFAIFAHMTAAAVVLAVWVARATESTVVGIACFAVAFAISAYIAWKLRRLFD